jgi:hypothetical protein
VNRKVLSTALAKFSAMLGIDPLAMWRELPPSTRRACGAAVDVAASAKLLLPPPPPHELHELLRLASEEEDVALELLQALSWCTARYGEDPIDGTAGVIGVPASIAAQASSTAAEVFGAARSLRQLREREGGMAGALLDYTGSRELAADVAATTLLLLCAGVPAPAAAQLGEMMRTVLQ